MVFRWNYSSTSIFGLYYWVKLLNTVDFGVPQNRQRVIVIGHKGEFTFPQVLDKKVTVGEALE